MSELYCGFEQTDEREGPVPYPVSCRPQAWAAGCGPLIVRTITGLEIEGDRLVTGAIGSGIVSQLAVDGIRALGEAWTVGMTNGHAFATRDTST